MIKEGGDKMNKKKTRTLWEIRKERWAAYKKLQKMQKTAK